MIVSRGASFHLFPGDIKVMWMTMILPLLPSTTWKRASTREHDDNDATNATFVATFSSTAFSIIKPPVDKVPVATLADDDPSAIGKDTHQPQGTAPPTQLADEPTAIIDANESPSDTEVIAMEKGEPSMKEEVSTCKQETNELEFASENKYSSEPSKEFIQVVLQRQRQARCNASTTAADATFGAASPIIHVDAITAPPPGKVLITTLADDDPAFQLLWVELSSILQAKPRRQVFTLMT